jgi:hypothetical protein
MSELKIEMTKKKHKYLQSGQGGVVVEEAGWNIRDLVAVQPSTRK